MLNIAAATQDELRARAKELADDIDANEVETRAAQRELDAIYRALDVRRSAESTPSRDWAGQVRAAQKEVSTWPPSMLEATTIHPGLATDNTKPCA